MSRSYVIEGATDEADAVILEESQRVRDHQVDSIHTVESKVAWMLRIGVVLLGMLISAVRLFGVSNLHPFVFAGVTLLALSLVVGLVAYGVSDIDVGAGPASIDVPENYERSDVYDAVVAAHEASIQFNRETLQTNEWFLTLTQTLLVVGVSLFVVGFLASA